MKNNLEDRVVFLEENLNATLDIILDLQKIISDFQDNMLEHAKITGKHSESISIIDEKMDDFEYRLSWYGKRIRELTEEVEK